MVLNFTVHVPLPLWLEHTKFSQATPASFRQEDMKIQMFMHNAWHTMTDENR